MLRRCVTSLRRGRANEILQRRFRTLSEALAAGAPIDVHPEVQQALAKNDPVVALETTIVTHGMPQPTNLETAQAVEGIVRSQGAIPATIGIIQGRVKIGLEPRELEYLADVQNTPVVKASRRDLGPVLALQRNGGTTCSTTLIFAAMAGIKVFATGGLGGVHRGGEHTLDVSADLPELSRCPVGLVSAGVKSILDIGRTLEYLETLGIPVLSYGADEFPAFYSRKSGHKSPWRVDDPQTAARLLHSQAQLGLNNGAVFAVPIPEDYEAVGAELQAAVEQALQEAEANGINKRGKEATPWLLKRVGELTAGKSLASNVALIKNTAQVGGQIAVSYANLVKNGETQLHTPLPLAPNSVPLNNELTKLTPSVLSSELDDVSTTADLLVIGCTALDVTSQATSAVDAAHAGQSTVPGVVETSLGGVGRNVAEAAHRLLTVPDKLKHEVVLVSPIGEDLFGRMLVEETARIGMRSDGFRPLKNQRTAVCNMLVDGKGDLVTGVADMAIIQAFSGEQAATAIDRYKPSVVAVDGNLSPETILPVVRRCCEDNIKVFFEPTSVTKSQRILPAISSMLDRIPEDRPPISYVSPNVLELSQLYQAASSDAYELTRHSSWWRSVDSMALSSEFRTDLQHLARRSASEAVSAGTLDFILEKGVAQMGINLLPFFQHIILKCGQRGVLLIFRTAPNARDSAAWAQEMTNLKQRQVIARGKNNSILVIKHYPAEALAQEELVNVTGAGDTLVGSLLASLVQDVRTFESPAGLDKAITRAQKAAVLTLKSSHAVSPLLATL